jgi:uncharacterized protein (DUF433 family)
MLGNPVIRGTRIPIELILRTLSEGASEADLVDAYPRLTREGIHARCVTSPTARFQVVARCILLGAVNRVNLCT